MRFVFIYFIIVIKVNSQNLVPNANFEDLSGEYCGYFPSVNSFESIVKNWKLPSKAKPILMSQKVDHKCWNFIKNEKGVYAQSDDHMMAICTFSSNSNYRTYLEIELYESLISNKYYYLEIWVRNGPYSRIASNNLGFYFSDTLVRMNTVGVLPFSPNVNHKEIVTDTSRWVLLKSKFKATSNSKYLLIGNFNSDEQTEIKPIRSNFPNKRNDAIFIYIDNIYLGLTPRDVNLGG